MKIYQIRELSMEDLRNAIQDNYDALENYRFQKATSQLENYKSLMNTKRDIARMLTILKERELGLNQDMATKEPKPKAKKKEAKEIAAKETVKEVKASSKVKASSTEEKEEKPKKTRKPAAKKSDSEKTEKKTKTKKAKSEN